MASAVRHDARRAGQSATGRLAGPMAAGRRVTLEEVALRLLLEATGRVEQERPAARKAAATPRVPIHA
jgi:hypothetical protein